MKAQTGINIILTTGLLILGAELSRQNRKLEFEAKMTTNIVEFCGSSTRGFVALSKKVESQGQTLDFLIAKNLALNVSARPWQSSEEFSNYMRLPEAPNPPHTPPK